MKTTHTLPLLYDHHNHPSLYCALSNCISLQNALTKQDALDRLRAEIGNHAILIALYWDSARYDFSTEDLADLPAAIIINQSLHSFRMNPLAQELLKDSLKLATLRFEDPEWVEINFRSILRWIVEQHPPTATQLIDQFKSLAQRGIWGAEEMIVLNRESIQPFFTAKLADRTKLWADPEVYAALSHDESRHIHGLKLIVDGAIGSYTAALHQAYRDSANQGVLVYSNEQLKAILNNVQHWGLPIAIHAIGDAAIENTIDVLETLKPLAFPSIQLEHVQLISFAYAQKAKALGLTLSMQPNFNFESIRYADRLTTAYCLALNPFRMLIDAVGFKPGQDLFFGSDGMPSGAEFALQAALFPPVETQRLSPTEFQAGYCMPDLTHGYLDVTIDQDRKCVCTRTIETG